MIRQPPGCTRTDTLLPDATLCRSAPMIRPLNILKRSNWVTPLLHWPGRARNMGRACPARVVHDVLDEAACGSAQTARLAQRTQRPSGRPRHLRSEEHTSELQSLMRSSYAVFCLKKKQQINQQ